jgi:hypothetical protein
MLEPFSGYKLVTGHGLFHLALLICTFMLQDKEITETKYDPDSISYAFDWGFRSLKCVHAWVFVFSIVDEYGMISMLVIDDNGFQKRRESNTKLMMFSKMSNCLAMFIYMYIVFNAQWTLAFYRIDFLPDPAGCFNPETVKLRGYQCWIQFETFLFYMYFISNVLYIMIH